MKTFAASDAKNNFGLLTDTALTQPVSITRHGRVILEIMTPEAKEIMIQARIKDFLWRQFLSDAKEAYNDYQMTNFHTNFEEMQNWANDLANATSNNVSMPECHK